jgi:hypothetical protein
VKAGDQMVAAGAGDGAEDDGAEQIGKGDQD